LKRFEKLFGPESHFMIFQFNPGWCGSVLKPPLIFWGGVVWKPPLIFGVGLGGFKTTPNFFGKARKWRGGTEVGWGDLQPRIKIPRPLEFRIIMDSRTR
jgi:hypothetical protein